MTDEIMRAVAEQLEDLMDGGIIADVSIAAPPDPTETLTEQTILDAMRRLQESGPQVICTPAVAAKLREQRLPLGVTIVESEHLPSEHVAYVWRPPEDAGDG